MARRKSTRSNNTNSRRPNWMAFITVAATLINAIVRLFKLFGSSGKKTAPPTRTTPPASPSRSPSRSSTPARRETPASTPTAPSTSRRTGRGVLQPGPVGSDGGIPHLFRQKRSDVIVTASGIVVKVLPDDLDTSDGSEMHQKFLVELADKDRTTVRVCHNLKFGRAPIKEGLIVGFKGEYEYTDKGGTVHWTHHDPIKIHEDGWLEVDGERYG